MYYQYYYHSPIGKLLLASSETNLIGLWMENQKYFAATLPENTIFNETIPILEKTKKWLDCYFHFEKPDSNELPLAPIGGDFRQRVWKILREIPYGKTLTYGDIAKKVAQEIGKKYMSAQAIGGAVGHNPISIIIPCHRVIGANGNLTGYAGGIDKKMQLLKIESRKKDIAKIIVL